MRKIWVEARKLEADLRHRNTIEIGSAVAVAVIFGAVIPQVDHWLARAGAAGVVAGAGFVAWRLVGHGRSAPLSAADATASFLESYRAELLRQAAFLAAAPLYYVSPLLLPAAVFLAGVQAQLHGVASLPAPAALLLCVLGGAISARNLYAARRLRRTAEALG
jgi:hypothetical protein